jgi:Na+-transporting methylmalonyl-CoA/oxaloacetate decarboxylase gamma subunit
MSNENELENEIENEIGEEISKEESQEQIEQEEKVEINPRTIAIAMQGISRILARKFDIQSFELTEQDVNDLTNALEPIKEQLGSIVGYFPYLPIIIFVIAYASRVIVEIMEKRKGKKEIVKTEEKVNENKP